MENNPGLVKYYREIFPAEDLFNVLEINELRELSFLTPQRSYYRFLTFSNFEEFKLKILEVNPMKMDVGAIHDIKPSKNNNAKAVSKELVFDIDLTDYPRNCCVEKTVCENCYEKIKCAIKLLDFSLREELGFKEIGFVFSGRRGVHCWVFDGKDLDIQCRTDIYKFYQQIIDKNLSVEKYNQIMMEFTDDQKDLIKNWFIRIDKQVTVSYNHLIKMPFSVHPDTGNISIPLDPKNITELKDVPKLQDVVDHPEILNPFIDFMKSWRIK